MNRLKTVLAIVLLPTLQLSTSSHANECNGSAPLADSENVENGYFELAAKPMAEIDRIRLRKLASELRGRWHGVELVKNCTGHFKSPVEEFQTYDVKANIAPHHSGAITLEAEKERHSDSVFKLDKLFMTPEIERGLSHRQDWYTLEFIDDNTVIFSEKYRAGNLKSFTRLIHEIKKIELQEDKLTVDRKLYVNGFFVAQSGWILQR